MTTIHRENRLATNELLADETIFSIANGYIGTRGTFTEGYGTTFDYPQTYLNGVYEFYDYTYEENLTGFPQEGQKFVNLLDGTTIEIYINEKPLNKTTAKVVSLKRDYNLDKGFTKRTIHYQVDHYDFILTETRVVSHRYRFVISEQVVIESPNYTGQVRIKSYLRKSKKPVQKNRDPRLPQAHSDVLQIDAINTEAQTIYTSTKRSNINLASAVVHSIAMDIVEESQSLVFTTGIQLDKNHPIELSKHIIHTSSLYDANYKQECRDLINIFSKISFIELLKTEEDSSTLFWDNSSVRLPNNPDLEELLQYNMFQLNRQGGEHFKHNISAKGLSGEGYEGHYFWDTEIYMIPFFTLTNPNKAKNLLLYRYHTMKAARQEAHNLGYKNGIKIPWRTINGTETSPYYPAGSAQFHINSDVAYAIIKYIEATNDEEFLIQYGFELLIETARFLAEAVNERDGVYHLNSVTGPDEYTTVVDDNFYTNVMLQYHFHKTVQFYRTYKQKLDHLSNDEEINTLFDIAEHIYLPYDKTLGIYAQDRCFLMKEKVDLSTIPKENFPLLLHYHPLYLYKHQVLKQADTMLALVLLDHVDQDVMRRSFEYYEPITTHDSSLSKCIYSVAAYQLELYDMAQSYFRRVLETDINDIHNNTKDGLHVANLGGSYLGFVYGLVGLRIHQDHIKLSPRVTHEINKYSVRFSYHGNSVLVTVDEGITIQTSGVVTVDLYGTSVAVDGIYQMALPQ